MRLILMFAALAMMGGCQHTTTVPEQPGQHTSAAIVSIVDEATQAHWIESHQDNELTSLLAQVQLSNVKIQQAQANLAFAQATTRKVRSESRPTLSIGSGYDNDSRLKDPAMGVSGLFKWEINLAGQGLDKNAAQHLRQEAEFYNVQALSHALALQATQTYWDYRAYEMKAALLVPAMRRQQSLLELARERQRLRMITLPELMRLEHRVAAYETMASSINEQQQLSLIILRTLSNNDQLTLTPVDMNQPVNLIKEPGQALYADLILQRPDVQQARLQLLATGIDIQVSEKAYFPTLSISAARGISTSTLAGLLTGNPWTLLNMALNMPLFDGGLTRAEIDRAKAVEQEAVYLYEERIQIALSDVHSAQIRLSAIEERQEIVQSNIQRLTRGLELAQAQQRLVNDLPALMDTQEMLVSAELELIDIQNVRRQQQAIFYHALGM